VSKSGSSTPPYTSWETASDSIQKCINICVDGDTIYVANGVYKENLVINTAISLIGSSMDSTVIDGRGMGDITINLNESFIMSNFCIYGKGYNIGDAAIRGNNPVEINNCTFRYARICMSLANYSVIAKNLIILDSRRGLSLASALNPNYEISNCFINLYNENSTGIAIGFAGNATGIIKNNLIIYSGTDNLGNGILLGSIKDVVIQNNLISGFLYSIFFDIINESSNILNTILTNNLRNQNAGASVWSQNDNLKIHNTIFQNNKIAIVGGDITADYNLFWENNQNINGTIALGDSNLYVDPMFVKDTIPTANGNYDFHLQAYSPAIDKGDPNILDVDGSRSDIGLFGGPYGQKYTYQDLAPKPPRNLTAAIDSGLVHLKWNKNTEADLFRYRLYRDTVPDFIYDTTKIIAVVADSFYYDNLPEKYRAKDYYYKLTAIDSAYNQSAASEEIHVNITGIPEAPPIVVEHYNLLQNYPNPFNPSTTIPYRLKESGYVKVMVYNILGEIVKVLVNQYQSAGYYEVTFSPDANERKRGEEGFPGMHTWYHSNYVSGVYLYRIEVIGDGRIPVYTEMKKMMLVK
jgi:hypothetical protein